MKYVADSSSSEPLKCEIFHGHVGLQNAERQCRRIVHKYAIAAGGVSAIPVPGAGVMFNDHALEALSSKILAIFELSNHQLARLVNEKSAKARDFGKITQMAIQSKRVRGALLAVVSKYGVMNVARLAPGVGTVIVSLTSVVIIEYFGHRLIDDCLMAVRSRAACKR